MMTTTRRIAVAALLMLSRWAKALLVLSLLALLAQDVWAFVLRDAAPAADKGLVLPILVNLIAIALAWLAFTADRRGWLR